MKLLRGISLLFILPEFLCLDALPQVSGTVTDIDNNVYKTIRIGNYTWMAENLKTRFYNDGREIPLVTDDSLWLALESGAYCWYSNDMTNRDLYGALYNWYAVNTGRLCPVGWRVPTDGEWRDLEGRCDSLYGVGNPDWNRSGLRGYDAGRQLKRTSGWRFGGNGSDSFGFSALPGGERFRGFNNIAGSNGYWWSCSEYDSLNGWYRSIIYSFNEISRDRHPKKMGFSVRCIKDL